MVWGLISDVFVEKAVNLVNIVVTFVLYSHLSGHV